MLPKFLKNFVYVANFIACSAKCLPLLPKGNSDFSPHIYHVQGGGWSQLRGDVWLVPVCQALAARRSGTGKGFNSGQEAVSGASWKIWGHYPLPFGEPAWMGIKKHTGPADLEVVLDPQRGHNWGQSCGRSLWRPQASACVNKRHRCLKHSSQAPVTAKGSVQRGLFPSAKLHRVVFVCSLVFLPSRLHTHPDLSSDSGELTLWLPVLLSLVLLSAPVPFALLFSRGVLWNCAPMAFFHFGYPHPLLPAIPSTAHPVKPEVCVLWDIHPKTICNEIPFGGSALTQWLSIFFFLIEV